jgi:hypothetical protein
MDYARAKGISKKYASSGWAAFERPFALWCEGQGIALDYVTQHDLHADPGLLDGYPMALIVGHDEYGPGKCATIWMVGWTGAAIWRGLAAISFGRPGCRTI